MNNNCRKGNLRIKVFRFIGIIISVLILTSSLTFFYVKAQIEDLVSVDTFYQGITVEGMDLGGMTMEEAEKRLYEIVHEYFNKYGIVLKYEDKTWYYDYEDLKMSSNYKDVLQNAYSVARRGSLWERMGLIKELQENPVSFEITISFTTDGIYEKLEAIATYVDRDAVNAALTYLPKENKKFLITEDKTGLSLDMEKLMESIEDGLKHKTFVELDIVPDIILPEISADELMQETNRIAVFYTVVEGTNNRKHNVFLAASRFDGMVVKPGEIVSFNETTGQRTSANGYRMAPVIRSDKSLRDSFGGGVCQTSTTIYNAVLRAGLTVIERRHHSFPIAYVDIGHDAAVSWSSVDLKFKNTSEAPVYIHTYGKGDRLYVEIYGRALKNADEIRLVSNIYARYSAPKPRIVKDINQKYVTYADQRHTTVQSRAGYKVKTYRVFYKDGKEVSRELISDDYFRPITGTVYVGVKERGA